MKHTHRLRLIIISRGYSVSKYAHIFLNAGSFYGFLRENWPLFLVLTCPHLSSLFVLTFPCQKSSLYLHFCELNVLHSYFAILRGTSMMYLTFLKYDVIIRQKVKNGTKRLWCSICVLYSPNHQIRVDYNCVHANLLWFMIYFSIKC